MTRRSTYLPMHSRPTGRRRRRSRSLVRLLLLSAFVISSAGVLAVRNGGPAAAPGASEVRQVAEALPQLSIAEVSRSAAVGHLQGLRHLPFVPLSPAWLHLFMPVIAASLIPVSGRRSLVHPARRLLRSAQQLALGGPGSRLFSRIETRTYAWQRGWASRVLFWRNPPGI